MALISLRNISVGFSGPPVLDSIDLTIEHGERVSMVGRNGQGKSTLMKVITGTLTQDSGQVQVEDGAKIAYLPQDVPQDITGTIYDVVAKGLGATADLLSQYQSLTTKLAECQSEETLAEFQKVQQALEETNGWTLQQRVEDVLGKLQLPANVTFDTLSGGQKRRTLLAQALVGKPDLLILDEPTNHLDIATITWLEKELLHAASSLLFVTHDRAFLRSLATRIIDLDRGQLKSYSGTWENYLDKKSGDLHSEDKAWENEDKVLAKEETWIRQGIKARRTRNEGRVRALKKLREERKSRRDRVGNVNLKIQDSKKSGHEVIEASDLSFEWEDQKIVRDFSINVTRGDRIGIIGPNGCGKTTLIKLLLGDLEPQQGTVHLGTKLEVCYFDQLRDQLDEEKTVQDNLCDGGDTVGVDGERRHVIGYLKDFLFEPDRARQPVRVLSGGERNRLLLAKLFTQPANVLVMDEPTNDLDSETLELLEVLLLNFKGTLLLVSHDREFLNNVVTSTIIFDRDGEVRTYVGGYDDWLRQRPVEPEKKVVKQASKVQEKPKQKKTRKLSFKEKKELEALPGQIETLELEQATLHKKIADPAFYQQTGDEMTALTKRLSNIESKLEVIYERWSELDATASP